MRLQQEIVLGIGGSRALDKTGLTPTIRHINEGHAAFVSLEKIRKLVQEGGLTFAEAREVATTGNVFTTHTPVPAGIDVFTPDLLWKYFGGYVGELGVSFDQFFDVGREVGGEKRELFSMAVLAMRLSTHQNAVSQLHAKVSRRLWRDVMPDLPLSEIPIQPITNGVHAPTWTAPEIAVTGVAENPEGVDRARPVGGARGASRAARRDLPGEARRGAPPRRGARRGDRPGGDGPRPARSHDRLRAALRHVQARDAALPRAEAARVPPPPDRPPRADPLRRQGAPEGRARQGVPADRRARRRAAGAARARRLPPGLRHGARPRARLRLRRLAEHARAAARGVRARRG